MCGGPWRRSTAELEIGKEVLDVNMKQRFEKFSRNNILLSVLMVVLGLLLIVNRRNGLEDIA